MKKVVMILLSVTMLLVSCAKQTTITTEQTDSYTQTMTDPTESNTVLPPEPTEITTEATEPSETPTDPVEDPNPVPSVPGNGFYDALVKGSMKVIGEYCTIEEAFSDYEMQSMSCGETEWNDFWQRFQKEHPAGHKEAFYLDDRSDVGFLVELVDDNGDGLKTAIIEELYAFNKLYDVKLEAYCWGAMHYGKSFRSIYATDDMVATVGGGSVQFICGDIFYSLARRRFEDPFVYEGRESDGVMRYSRGVKAITAMQSFYDWAKEYWYPGYGAELAAESGTVTLVDGELVFTPDESYTVEEWLMGYAHLEEKMQKTGYETLDEYMDAYLYGELNPYKNS